MRNKKPLSLLIIYSLLLFSFAPLKTIGQTQNSLSDKTISVPKKIGLKKEKLEIIPDIVPVKNSAELNSSEILKNEKPIRKISKLKKESKLKRPKIKVNFEEINKIPYKQTSKQKKKGWSTSDKVILATFIAGLTVLLVFLIKYGKVPNCDDVACDPFIDENCICEN